MIVVHLFALEFEVSLNFFGTLDETFPSEISENLNIPWLHKELPPANERLLFLSWPFSGKRDRAHGFF